MPLTSTQAVIRQCASATTAANKSAEQLCEGHALAQKRLRAGVEGRPASSSPAPVSPAWLLELAAALVAPWRALAACRGQSAVMFPESDRRRPLDYGPALSLCASCPVVVPCRAAGRLESAGVWGGLVSGATAA